MLKSLGILSLFPGGSVENKKRILIIDLLLATLFWACGSSQTDVAVHPSTQVSFADDVLPIFQKNCTRCHGEAGGLSLESYSALMAGQQGEPIVIAGNPGRSDIVEVIEDARMPKMVQGFHQPTLTRELSLLKLWIAQGAKNN